LTATKDTEADFLYYRNGSSIQAHYFFALGLRGSDFLLGFYVRKFLMFMILFRLGHDIRDFKPCCTGVKIGNEVDEILPMKLNCI